MRRPTPTQVHTVCRNAQNGTLNVVRAREALEGKFGAEACDKVIAALGLRPMGYPGWADGREDDTKLFALPAAVLPEETNP